MFWALIKWINKDKDQVFSMSIPNPIFHIFNATFFDNPSNFQSYSLCKNLTNFNLKLIELANLIEKCILVFNSCLSTRTYKLTLIWSLFHYGYPDYISTQIELQLRAYSSR